MTVYVELELTAYLLSVDDCRHVIISFIEQCQYGLVNIVVDKDNTFLRTLNQVGHESIGIKNLPIVGMIRRLIGGEGKSVCNDYFFIMINSTF